MFAGVEEQTDERQGCRTGSYERGERIHLRP
jgi:hypothetical protein